MITTSHCRLDPILLFYALTAQDFAACLSSITVQEFCISVCLGVLLAMTTLPKGNGWPWLQEMSLNDHITIRICHELH